MNGSNVRCPEASGGSSRARILAKRQVVLSVDQSCPTERRESRMEGTRRTPVNVKSITRLRESRTDRGKSPTATHGRGFPFSPETDSEQDFRLFKSCAQG
eukprot:6189070-Pleurochrysis_carterae.AAC.2